MIILAGPSEELLGRYRESLRGSYTVVEASNLAELTRILKNQEPQAAFVQSAIFNSTPQSAFRSLLLQHPKVPFVVFGCREISPYCLSFLTAGARGLLPLISPPAVVPKVIAAIRRGELWVSRRGLAAFLDGSKSASAGEFGRSRHISEREMQVARIAATGLSNKEIARSLDISERTVKAHISSLFEKLNIRNRSALVLLWRAGGRPPGSSGEPCEPQEQ